MKILNLLKSVVIIVIEYFDIVDKKLRKFTSDSCFLMHPDLMTVWYLYHPYFRSYKFCRGCLTLDCAFQIVDFIHVKNIESNCMLTLYPEQFSGISPDLKWG